MSLRKCLWVITVLLCAFLLNGGTSVASEKIVLLISLEEAPFKQTVAGFNEYLTKQGIQASYEMYSLEGDSARVGPAIQKIKQSNAKLVFALGSLATDAALRELPDIPIVAGLVLRTDNLKQKANATGVGLEFPLETQFEWMRRFLPQAHTIGVIYNPEENQKRIDSAARIAKKQGLRLAAQQIHEPQDVPAALNNLSKGADVLWGVADSLALSPQIAKNILLFSFRNSIPFVGPSSTWAKAGALYSLDWDYADLGAQCGEMAHKVLTGALPSSIPVEMPRKVMYSVNLFTARQLKISLPDDLVRGALHTY